MNEGDSCANGVDRLPAWTPSGYDAAGKAPKIFVNDSGLAAHLLRVHSVGDLERLSPAAEADCVGKLLETWVYAQLMPEVDLHPLWRVFHFRADNNHEIDFLLVNDKEEYLGVEVKASQSVRSEDFKHLQWFRARHPDKKFIGVVLYCGNLVTRPAASSERLYGIPMACFWESQG